MPARSIIRHGRKIKVYGPRPADGRYEVRWQEDGATQRKSRATMGEVNLLLLELDERFRLGLSGAFSRDELRRAEALAPELNGTPLHEVIQFYLDHRSPFQDKRISDALAEFLTTREGLRPRSVQTYESLARKLEPLGRYTFGEISAASAEALFVLCRGSAHNNLLRFCCTFWAWAQKKGYASVQHNPFANITPARIAHKDPELLAPADLWKLVDKVGWSLLLSAHTGMRSGELARLQWRHLQGDQIALSREVTKTGKGRVIQMREVLTEFMRRAKNRAISAGYEEGELVFPDLCPVRRKIADTARQLGIDLPPNVFRKTAVSAMAALAPNLQSVADQTGHSVDVLQTHYLGWMSLEDASAWFLPG